MLKNNDECSAKIEFFSNSEAGKIAEIAKEKAPYSKILLLSNSDTFIKRGLETVEVLKSAGHRVLNAVYPSGFVLSVNSACGLFTASEDVRLVISLSNDLNSLADYFGSVRRVSVITLSDCWSDGLVRKKLFVRNGDGLDFFDCSANKTVIIKRAFENKADAFCCVAEKKFQLFDYFVRALFTGEEFLRDSVYDTLNLLDGAKKIILSSADYCDIDREVGEAVARVTVNYQKFFGEPLTSVAAQACGGAGYYARLLMAKQVLRLTEKVLSGNTIDPPDYNGRAQSVSALLGFSLPQVLRSLHSQTEILNRSVVDFTAELYKTKEYIENACLTAQTLGATAKRLNPKQLSALKIAGDTPFGINLMSVCRDYN